MTAITKGIVFGTALGATLGTATDNDEFWYTATNGDRPLYGSLFFVFFLLLVWNALLAVDGWRHPAGNKVLLVVNVSAY